MQCTPAVSDSLRDLQVVDVVEGVVAERGLVVVVVVILRERTTATQEGERRCHRRVFVLDRKLALHQRAVREIMLE